MTEPATSIPCARCGARLPPGRAEGVCARCLLGLDEPPVLLGGKYELLEELGAGGMGTVYRARDTRLGRVVALKLLADELGADPSFRARFVREARTLASLNHPGIVALYDFGEDEGQLFIAMELVAGSQLDVTEPMPSDRAARIALQLCEAVAYAHGQGIVHRDIKPANLLIGPDDSVKLADFGIARLHREHGAGHSLTGSLAAAGTPHFMAPEALAGAPPDPRMDVYSLGVLLFQMLTAKLPVGAFDPPPGPLGEVVMRALAADPARRVASAEELRQALLAAAGQPAAAAHAANELPSHERQWQRAVAVLASVSAALGLWAMLECVQPRVLSPADAHPLVMFGTRPLPDGRLYSPARFETLAVLIALAGLAPTFFAYGMLRRHWRRNGLDRPDPDRPIPQGLRLLGAGVLALVTYGIKQLLVSAGINGIGTYAPLAGGLIEIFALYFFCDGLLECQRRSRLLRREPLLLIGFVLALVPPAIELLGYLRRG
jgi:serine/threonine protein kinase